MTGLVKVIFVFLCFKTVISYNYTDEKRLMDTFQNADNQIRPIFNVSSPIIVTISFSLTSVRNLDMKNQALSSTAHISVSWIDEFRKWDKRLYGGLDRIKVSFSKMWKPDVILANSLGNKNILEENEKNVIIQSSGQVIWTSHMDLKTTCKVNTTYYPFDVQLFNFNFSKLHSDDTVQENRYSELDNVSKDFVSNGEWVLSSKTVRLFNISLNRNGKIFSDIIWQFEVDRRQTYYVWTYLVPSVAFSLMSLVSILLPVKSMAKLTISGFSFLAFPVLINVFNSSMPSTSENNSLFGILLSVNLGLSILVIIVNCVITTIFYRKVPACLLKCYIFCKTCKLKCCQCPKCKSCKRKFCNCDNWISHVARGTRMEDEPECLSDTENTSDETKVKKLIGQPIHNENETNCENQIQSPNVNDSENLESSSLLLFQNENIIPRKTDLRSTSRTIEMDDTELKETPAQIHQQKNTDVDQTREEMTDSKYLKSSSLPTFKNVNIIPTDSGLRSTSLPIELYSRLQGKGDDTEMDETEPKNLLQNPLNKEYKPNSANQAEISDADQILIDVNDSKNLKSSSRSTFQNVDKIPTDTGLRFTSIPYEPDNRRQVSENIEMVAIDRKKPIQKSENEPYKESQEEEITNAVQIQTKVKDSENLKSSSLSIQTIHNQNIRPTETDPRSTGINIEPDNQRQGNKDTEKDENEPEELLNKEKEPKQIEEIADADRIQEEMDNFENLKSSLPPTQTFYNENIKLTEIDPQLMAINDEPDNRGQTNEHTKRGEIKSRKLLPISLNDGNEPNRGNLIEISNADRIQGKVNDSEHSRLTESKLNLLNRAKNWSHVATLLDGLLFVVFLLSYGATYIVILVLIFAFKENIA